uniref:Uncharacterized protein n=1 Tax=Anguilla anguilla TaxID=7936 RepID=A0A0E9UX78_ANGAN
MTYFLRSSCGMGGTSDEFGSTTSSRLATPPSLLLG